MTKLLGKIFVSTILLAALASIPMAVAQVTATTCSPWTIQRQAIDFQTCAKSGNYSLNWIVNGTAVTIGFSYPTTTDWVGIGFTKDTGKMIGASAIIGKPTAKGVKVQEYLLNGKTSEAVVLGGNLKATGLAGEIVNGELRFIFTVVLPMAKVTLSNLIWTHGPYEDSSDELEGHMDGQEVADVSFNAGVSVGAGDGISTGQKGTSGTVNTTGCSPWTIQGRTINFGVCTNPGKYSLNWILSGTTVTIGFSYPTTTNWVGIAFTKDSGRMIDAKAVIGKPTPTGVIVQEYYLGGKSANQVVPRATLNATGLAGEIVNGVLRFVFTVELPKDKVALSNLIWAHGPYQASSDSLNFHADGQDTGDTSFLTGLSNSGGGGTDKSLRNAHGLINAIAWGLLIPFGILVARHGKRQDPAWYYFHLVCQSLGLILGLMGLITGLVSTHRSENEYNSHKTVAIFVVVLGVLQVLALCLRPHKGAKLRGVWEIQHHWSGRAAVILAVANCYVGLNILKPGTGWTVLFSIIIGLFAVATVALEAWRQFLGGGVPDHGEKLPLQDQTSLGASRPRSSMDDIELQRTK